MSDINLFHPQYAPMTIRWERNRDACKGQLAVKSKGRQYLPDDNANIHGTDSIDGPEGDKDLYRRQYRNYLERAVFMSFSQNTRDGWTGMIFAKPPTVVLPTGLKDLEENVDGAGLSLTQLAKSCSSETIEVGRIGLLADYPRGIEGATKEDDERLNLRPRIVTYASEDIVDWDEDTFGSVTKLTMVKLREVYFERADDGNGWKDPETRYRILRLDNEIYTQELVDESGSYIDEPFMPTMAGGKPFDHIPFGVAGSENNKMNIDDAPISGIVDLNLSHYVNSADLEASMHRFSMATLMVCTGEESATDFTKRNPAGVQLGQGIALGNGGSIKIEQMADSPALSNHLTQKEEQAEKIGARFAGEGTSKNVTAEAARINAANSTATLTTLVGNVSEAIEARLEDCALFVGADPKTVEFELNDQFYGDTFDKDLYAVAYELYMDGAISKEEFKNVLNGMGMEFKLDGEGKDPVI